MRLEFLFVLLIVSLVNAGFEVFTYGGRANKLYVPNNYDPNRPNGYPLFVMLHGCSQNPDDFAAGTKMNTYAEQHGFFVLYPLQPSTANIGRCWNWFDVVHQSRGRGEPAFIAEATTVIAARYKIDAQAVFCGGLSAGGAMTVIMGVTYPDIFSGIAVGAGLEYKAAISILGSYTAMASGGPPPSTQAGIAYNAMRNLATRPITVLVIHGTSDYTVNSVNGQQVTEQWITTNNLILGQGTNSQRIPLTPTQTTNGNVPGGFAYVDMEHSDKETGAVIVRYLRVTSMGHAWSGGSNAGSYADPKGPDASLYMVNWFLERNSKLVYGANVTHFPEN